MPKTMAMAAHHQQGRQKQSNVDYSPRNSPGHMATKADKEEAKTLEAKAMYDEIDNNDHNPLYSNSGLATFVQSFFWDMFVIFVIIVYALWLWFETDVNYDTKYMFDEKRMFGVPELFFQVVEIVFTVIFVFELVLRFLAYEKKYHFFIDKQQWYWNVMDTFLVSTMVFENIIIFIIDKVGSAQFQMPNVAILRLFRLARIFRLLRMHPELMMMTKSMVAAIKTVSITFALLGIFMYIYAILFTQWIKDSLLQTQVDDHDLRGTALGAGADLQDQLNVWYSLELPVNEYDEFKFGTHWGTIIRSMLTLGQIVIFDGSFDLVRPVFYVTTWGPLYGIALIVYMLIGSLLLLNMLIGVICEIVGSVNQDEKERMLMDKLILAFRKQDTDLDGTITKFEFDEAAMTKDLQFAGLSNTLCEKLYSQLGVGMNNSEENDMDIRDFLNMVNKLNHPPEANDLLLVMKRTERILKVLGHDGETTVVAPRQTQPVQMLNMNQNQSSNSLLSDGPFNVKKTEPFRKPMAQIRPITVTTDQNDIYNDGLGGDTTSEMPQGEALKGDRDTRALTALLAAQSKELKKIERELQLLKGIPEQLNMLNWRLDQSVSSPARPR